jgi:hypothetical protein
MTTPLGMSDPLTAEKRRQSAIDNIRRNLPVIPADIHCIIDLTRTGQGAWVRVIAIARHDHRPAWPVDITYSVAVVTGIKAQDRGGCTWLSVRRNGSDTYQATVAERMLQSLVWPTGSITGHVL